MSSTSSICGVESAAATLLILAADRAMASNNLNHHNDPIKAVDYHRRGGNCNSPIDTAKVMVSVASKQQQHVTASAELRKVNKPFMEKRRRARINKSLNELKSLLMESMERNTPGHSKWEKADILEMTVQYLHCLRNQQKATRVDPLSVGQFIAGFSECIRLIQKFDSKNINNNNNNNSHQKEQKLTEYLLSYLKTFSDDATRALRVTNDNHCPTPPGTTGGGSSSSTTSTNHSPPLSSFTASPSPSSPDSDGSDDNDDDQHRRLIITTMEHDDFRDRNHNNQRITTGLFSMAAASTNNNNNSSDKDLNVWRPW